MTADSDVERISHQTATEAGKASAVARLDPVLIVENAAGEGVVQDAASEHWVTNQNYLTELLEKRLEDYGPDLVRDWFPEGA